MKQMLSSRGRAASLAVLSVGVVFLQEGFWRGKKWFYDSRAAIEEAAAVIFTVFKVMLHAAVAAAAHAADRGALWEREPLARSCSTRIKGSGRERFGGRGSEGG